MIPRAFIRPFARAVAIPAFGLLASCGIFPPAEPKKARAVPYEWHDDGGPGAVSVKIDISRQLATYRRGDRKIGWSLVSTGKEGHATATGNYSITEKMPVKYSNRYGWLSDRTGMTTNGDATPDTPVPEGQIYRPAPMYYWMRITSYGIGMHAGDIPKPGTAASHGCIRLPREFAPILYEAVKVGTPVEVVHGKRQEPTKMD